MPQHKEKRTLPFRPDQLFDLVADIERYPEFLPWCKGARILERKGDVITADLIIGYKIFREKFTSVVTLDKPRKISVQYLSGPLAHLKNEWEFQPAGNGLPSPERSSGFAQAGCDLLFHVDFDFRSHMLGAIMEPFFDKALSKMAAAFEERARELYG